MSKKSKKLKKEQEMRMQQKAKQQQQPRIICQPMANGFPMAVAPASNFIQLTPIVQPIALVPYSTQQQPLLTFLDDDDLDNY